MPDGLNEFEILQAEKIAERVIEKLSHEFVTKKEVSRWIIAASGAILGILFGIK